MQTLFQGIDLGDVQRLDLTINAPARSCSLLSVAQ